MSRLHIGIPGTLAALVFLGWAVGWIVFDLHNGPYHLLVAVAAFLMLVQVVRRIAAH